MITRSGKHLRCREAGRCVDCHGVASPRNKGVVAPATKKKVLAAVERLGYVPDAAGRNLRMRRGRKLLVTVPDISRPMFSLILQGIEDTANREGYAVLLGDTHYDQGREEQYALNA